MPSYADLERHAPPTPYRITISRFPRSAPPVPSWTGKGPRSIRASQVAGEGAGRRGLCRRLRPGCVRFGARRAGPPPVVTDEGILLIYNSSDGKRYNVGQALFSKDDPAKLIDRLDEPCLSPELAWEKWGKVNHVVFAEGLVKREGRGTSTTAAPTSASALRPAGPGHDITGCNTPASVFPGSTRRVSRSKSPI